MALLRIELNQTEFTQTLADLKKLHERVGKFKVDMHRINADNVREAGDYIASRMYEYAPEASGELRKSIKVTQAVTGKWGTAKIGESGITVSVGKGLYRPYHYYQEYGSNPHIIPASYIHSPYEGYMGYAAAPYIPGKGRDPNPMDNKLKMIGSAVYGRPEDRKGFRLVSTQPTHFISRAFDRGATFLANASVDKIRKLDLISKGAK